MLMPLAFIEQVCKLPSSTRVTADNSRAVSTPEAQGMGESRSRVVPSYTQIQI